MLPRAQSRLKGEMSIESNRLQGDVAFVTGAGSGIARMVAIKLALNGAVAACADLNQAKVEETVRTIKELGGEAFAVLVDVGNSVQVRKAMADVYQKAGKISILVNCAGIVSYTHIEDCSDEEWERIMNVNIGGYFRCLREVSPYMKKSGGRIVQFSSSTALSGSAYAGPAYAASKAAAIGLSKYIAGLWVKHGIRCNTICPGLTDTTMGVVGQGEIKDKKEQAAKNPMGRIGNPEDMANVVLFLVSDESRYMTGQTLHVNGGKYMYNT